MVSGEKLLSCMKGLPGAMRIRMNVSVTDAKNTGTA
jgi:hypothetical protein